MEDEEWERYCKSLNVKSRPFINCEYYVPFQVKYAHLPRRPTRPATEIPRRRRIRIHGQLPAAAGTNAQGVAQISNGVSVLNLGQSSVANPSPAAAASSSSSSGTNARGVAQISNGVSVLDLGQGQSSVVANPNPAIATSSGHNNY